jgi:hypothetical protein
MKIAIAIFLSLILLKLNTAEARCNGGYASHLLAQRYTGCSGNLGETVSLSRGVGRAVTAVCMDGCYSAIFNANLKPECDRKYAAALESFQTEVARMASQMGCKDSGAYNSQNDVLTVLPPDRASRWLSRTAVKLKCGGNSNNICGTGKKGICAGDLICTSSFEYGSSVLQPGVFGVSCLSSSGSCSEVSIADCIKDEMTDSIDEPYYDGLLNPTVDSAKGIN